MTGTPGTGKTAFSRMLAKQLEAQYFSLGSYIIQHGIYVSVDRKRKSKIVDVSKARSMMQAILSKNTFLIVDTHMPEEIIPKDATRMVLVLRCNPQLLERRLRRRKWTVEKVKENVMAEILDSCLIAAQKYYGKKKVTQLDTSYASVKSSVLLARKILLRSKFPKSSVDWLRKLETDKSFEKYLEW
ncbi:MAG: AAA family ATPase [Candidatus Bathyarchaeia archaeon]